MKAVISGASRGIGKAITEQLAQEGAELILLARGEHGLNKLSDSISSKNATIHSFPLDLSQEESFNLIEEKRDLFQGVTTIINNLGIYSTQDADRINIKTLQNQINVNLYSAIQLTQALLHQSTNSTISRIINIGSVMSLNASPNAADYSISKHAFKGWNDSLRDKLRFEGIKVSAIYPGAVNTSSWDGIDAPREEMIQAKDIAKAVSYILSLSENTLIEEIRISPQTFGS